MYQQYDKAVQSVLDHLIEHSFSRTVRKDFGRATSEFKEYLEEGHREYSHAIAQAWLTARKTSIPRRKYFSFRRAISLVDDAAKNGSLTNATFSYDDTPFKKYRVPECYRPLLDAYIERRRREGNQSSTLQVEALSRLDPR